MIPVTIIFTGIVFWQARIFLSKFLYSYRSRNDSLLEMSIGIEQLKLAEYLAIGFVIGFIIITLILKKVNKRSIKKKKSG